MAIEYKEEKIVLTDIVTAEDAEGLLEWLQSHPQVSIDLTALTHLHAANLQVLLAARPQISAWPQDEQLAAWLKNSLQGEQP